MVVITKASAIQRTALALLQTLFKGGCINFPISHSRNLSPSGRGTTVSTEELVADKEPFKTSPPPLIHIYICGHTQTHMHAQTYS